MQVGGVLTGSTNQNGPFCLLVLAPASRVVASFVTTSSDMPRRRVRVVIHDSEDDSEEPISHAKRNEDPSSSHSDSSSEEMRSSSLEESPNTSEESSSSDDSGSNSENDDPQDQYMQTHVNSTSKPPDKKPQGKASMQASTASRTGMRCLSFHKLEFSKCLRVMPVSYSNVLTSCVYFPTNIGNTVVEMVKKATDMSVFASQFTYTRLPQPHNASPRTVRVNKGGRSNSRAKVRDSNCKIKTAQDFLKEYPNQGFEVRDVFSRPVIFCVPCGGVITCQSGTIHRHCGLGSKNQARGRKHQASLKLWTAGNLRRESVLDSVFQIQKANPTLPQSTLPAPQILRRMQTLGAFLSSGTPLSRLPRFEKVLEEDTWNVGNRQSMGELIPQMLQIEMTRLHKLFTGQYVSAIFDGTCQTMCCRLPCGFRSMCHSISRVVLSSFLISFVIGTPRFGETEAIIFRSIDDNMVLRQAVVNVTCLPGNFNQDELAKFLGQSFFKDWSIGAKNLISVTRDGAPVNGAAVANITAAFYTTTADITCVCHALNNCGQRVDSKSASAWMSVWTTMFSKSNAAKRLWQARCDENMPLGNNTRWWTSFDLMKYVAINFFEVEPFLKDLVKHDSSKASAKPLLSVLAKEKTAAYVRVELAAIVETCMPLANYTKLFEGDSPVVTAVYDAVMSINLHLDIEYHPATRGLIDAAPVYLKPVLERRALECVAKVKKYFRKHFIGPSAEFAVQMRVFECARMFDPLLACQLKITVRDLCEALPFLQPLEADLNAQRAAYLLQASVYKIPAEENGGHTLQWWMLHGNKVPAWKLAARMVFSMSPSSAAVERVFSLLSNVVLDTQESMKVDYLRLVLMLGYNHDVYDLEIELSAL